MNEQNQFYSKCLLLKRVGIKWYECEWQSVKFKVVKWGWKEGDCHFKFKTFKLSEC